ncbi:MAG: hypothetical protein MUO26_04950 [Methanotrichaceae archaeon]|nr:hypothetical protein [Methanotrichaceae archaeon]
MMNFTEWANNKVKKLTWVDIGLIKLSVAAFVLMIAKLWSPLLSLGLELDWANIHSVCDNSCKEFLEGLKMGAKADI